MVEQGDYYRSVYPMVALLAADAATQVRSVPAGAMFAEDVLEDADLIFSTAIGSVGRTTMSEAEIGIVADLHRAIENVTVGEGPGSSFWTDEALSGPKWEAIRRAARRALGRLNELRGPPE